MGNRQPTQQAAAAAESPPAEAPPADAEAPPAEAPPADAESPPAESPLAEPEIDRVAVDDESPSHSEPAQVPDPHLGQSNSKRTKKNCAKLPIFSGSTNAITPADDLPHAVPAVFLVGDYPNIRCDNPYDHFTENYVTPLYRIMLSDEDSGKKERIVMLPHIRIERVLFPSTSPDCDKRVVATSSAYPPFSVSVVDVDEGYRRLLLSGRLHSMCSGLVSMVVGGKSFIGTGGANQDPELFLFDGESGRMVGSIGRESGRTDEVLWVESWDREALYVSDGSTAPIEYSLAEGRMGQSVRQFQADRGSSLLVAFQEKNALIGNLQYQQTLVLWDRRTPDPERTLPLNQVPQALHVAEDRNLLLMACGFGGLGIWDLRMMEEQRQLSLHLARRPIYNSMGWPKAAFRRVDESCFMAIVAGYTLVCDVLKRDFNFCAPTPSRSYGGVVFRKTDG